MHFLRLTLRIYLAELTSANFCNFATACCTARRLEWSHNMQSRFRVSSLLLLTLFILLIVWSITGITSDGEAFDFRRFQLRSLLSFIAIGAAFALRSRQTRPLISAAMAGAHFVVSLTCIGVTDELIGYFFYTGIRPYYEYGFFIHTFIFPFVICFLFCPVAALVSVLSGWIAIKCVSARSAD